MSSPNYAIKRDEHGQYWVWLNGTRVSVHHGLTSAKLAVERLTHPVIHDLSSAERARLREANPARPDPAPDESPPKGEQMANAIELLGTDEVAELLGVTRGRVYQLVTQREDFPAPAMARRHGSGTTRFWSRADVEHWRDTADRRPGPHGAAA